MQLRLVLAAASPLIGLCGDTGRLTLPDRAIDAFGHVRSADLFPSVVGTNMMDQWIGDYPHPIRLNLARYAPPPVGEVRGFEVLGFEAGRLHSWLCYGLLAEATETLGIHVNGLGLLATLIGAQEVADMANSNRGTPDGTPADVTWFPALLTEHGTEQHGRVRSSSPIGHGSRP